MKKIAALLAIVGFILFGSGVLLAQAQAQAVPGAGITSEITGVTIGDDELPVVTFTLADENGNPLSMDDVQSINFLIARVEEDPDTGLARFMNYFTQTVSGAEYQYQGETKEPALDSVDQPRFENGSGAFAEIGPGEYTYTFGEALGSDYNPRETQFVGAEIIRGPRSVAANPTYSFTPAGNNPHLTPPVLGTEACNACHRDLGAHGGSRKEVALCVLCHTPQNVDPETGNSLDLKVLVHRIHSGAQLPSVQAGTPYFIVGHNQNVADFSSVVWPQDTRNCSTCHVDPEQDDYLNSPNKEACTACHDDADPTIALNHPGNPKPADSCSRCHYPDMVEFDQESIPGAHVIPRYSQQIAGVNLAIVSVDNAAPGQSPTVTFAVTHNDGSPIAPADMDYLAVTLAGPTTDYTNRVTETIFRKPSDNPPNVQDAGNGAFSYTFNYVIPEDATGTYGFALEGYVMETLDDVPDPVRVAGFNPVAYANLNGGTPDPRRDVVNRDNCNACHKDLALHGTIRQNTEYCVMCHNPNATDEEQRPADAMPPTSINFRVMIHRIHDGAEASNPLQVYGYGGSLHDFSTVGFPGVLSACDTCHNSGTYTVQLSGLQPTTITEGGEIVSQTQPARSVCTSCHDTAEADGHAQLQTTVADVETCTVCHGPGREFDVTAVHP